MYNISIYGNKVDLYIICIIIYNKQGVFYVYVNNILNTVFFSSSFPPLPCRMRKQKR